MISFYLLEPLPEVDARTIKPSRVGKYEPGAGRRTCKAEEVSKWLLEPYRGENVDFLAALLD